MSTITNLNVNLLANTRTFDSKIKKSQGVFGAFGSKLGSFSGAKLAGGFAAIAGAAAGLVGVARSLKSINAQFEKIDQLAKYSDSVGATVGEMKALRLQGELTGTSQSTLDAGIQRYVRTLGEAKAGISTGTKAMEAFGLSADELSRMPLSQQLGLVSDKIKQQTNAADKAALAYQLFGRKGQEMLTFLESGSEGIQAATKDIERFNGGLSRVDAAQIEMANDAFTRLQALTDSIWQSIAVESAPTLTALVEMFTDAAVHGEGFGGIVETSFEILNAGIGFALDGWNMFMGAWHGGQAIVTAVIANTLDGIAKVEQALVAIGGETFDFGVQDMATAAWQTAEDLGKQSIKEFNAGLDGTASQDFEQRMAEIRKRGLDQAAKQNSALEQAKIPPLEVKKPEPINGDGLLEGLAAVGTSIFDTVASMFPEPEERPDDAGFAAGLSRFSAEAQSVVNQFARPTPPTPANNQTNRENDGIKDQIKKSGDEQNTLLGDMLEATRDIASSFQGGGGVIVGLDG